MKILGIDPGFGRLGYAIIEKNGESSQITVIDCSCFETDSKTEYYKRLLAVAEKIRKLMIKYRPDAVAVEKIFFTQNKKTAFQIAEIRGIIIYLAVSSKIPVFEYTPLEVKMALCGYGRADKNQISKMLELILGLKYLPKKDDAADALAISLTCANSISSKMAIK